jgi:hypothetical protein
LAEVEVLDKAGKNLAAGAQVFVSAGHRPGDPRNGATLIDGNTDSQTEKVGYWMPLNEQPGWAEIRLLPQEAAPPEPSQKSVATNEAGKTGGKKNRKSLDAKIYACGDDSFEMSVNGLPVLNGNLDAVSIGSVALAAGDVIAVKAMNDEGDVGFACAIKFSNGQLITTSDGWQAYTPANVGQWAMPKQVKDILPVVPADSDLRPSAGVNRASGADVAQIWAPGHPQISYLFYVVGKIDIPKKQAAK